MCQVVDASTSINTNLSNSDNTNSTFQDTVKPFLANLTSRIQQLAG